MQRQNVHFEFEFVFNSVAAVVADVDHRVIFVLVAVALEVLLGAEQFSTIGELAGEVRVEHVQDTVVRHDAEFGGDGLVAEVAGVGCVVVLDVLLQTRPVLENTLAGTTARQ